MHDRSPITAASRRGPLHGLCLPQGADVSLSQATDAARFLLRGDGTQIAAFGPATPALRQASTAGTRAALWMGPDEFLLMALGEDAATVEVGLRKLCPAGISSLVDISHRQIGLVLEGRLAARCLSAGCPLDFALTAFPVGMAARTMFLKAEVIIWRQAETRFHVEIWRSFAPYLTGHVANALAGASGL